MTSAIYESTVRHRRFKPMGHALKYSVYGLLIDLDDVDDVARRIPVFSRNRWNLVSFHDEDHGPRDGSDLEAWFLDVVGDAGVDLTGGNVSLLVFPRILGYTFNPITVWFGRNRAGDLRAVLYEVHNTFGHAHSHLAILPEGTEQVPSHGFDKVLHVSPFFDRDGSYEVSLMPPDDRYRLTIEYLDGDGDRLLTASQFGSRVDLSSSSLLRQFFRTPLLTLKVIGGIHWEALKLWRKGATYRPIPPPPTTEVLVTYVDDPMAAATP